MLRPDDRRVVHLHRSEAQPEGTERRPIKRHYSFNFFLKVLLLRREFQSPTT